MYDEFYNLTKKPFQLNPDPEFFFNSAVHKRALAYLRYGLAQGEGFIVVTGAPGTGKTMLVKALFENLKNEDVVAGLMVTSQVGAEDTLRIIAATFGLSYDGDAKAVLLKNLENFFRAQARQGKRVLLVVDEAQNLPNQSLEELRMLSNFELNGKSLFQAFLLGQDEFRLTLQADYMDQVRQRVTATYHLRPLDKEETRDYIVHRLTMAGWDNDPHFNEQAYAEIYQYTRGIPRVINTLCDRLLLYGFLEELHQIDQEAVKAVINEIKEDEPAESELHLAAKENPKLTLHSLPLASAGSAINSGSIEERVRQLENIVESLRRTLQKERALLRKAILIQLDMDGVYEVTDEREDSDE